MVSGGERGLSPLPSPMVWSGTRTYVLVKAGNARYSGCLTVNHKIWSRNAPFWLLPERFGRGSVSNRSTAADAVRAFVVPFNSVSAVPARPAMGFRVLPAARRSRACGRCGLPGSWWSPARPAARRVPPESPASLSQEKTKARVSYPDGAPLFWKRATGRSGAGLRVWPPQGNQGRPAKERDAPADRDAGRPATPAGTRMASGHDSPSRLKMSHSPGAGPCSF